MHQSSILGHFPIVKSIAKRFRAEENDSMKKSAKKDPSDASNILKSLLTPIAQIPLLSQSTQAVIDTLNISSSNTNIDNILAGIPAKEKYADLLDPMRGFPLPYKYKKLLTALEMTDKALNYFALIKQNTPVTGVLAWVLDKCKTTVSIENLQQIQSVFNAYELYWDDKVDKKLVICVKACGNFECIDGQLAPEALIMRKQELNRRLFAQTQVFYEDFMLKNALEAEKYSWHPDFPLNEVPEILISPLPEPKSEAKSIISNHIIPRNAAVTSVFTEMKQIYHKNLEATAKPKTIPETFIENKKDNEKDTKTKDRIIGLCEYLKSLFMSMRTPSIFYSNLAKKMIESTLGEFLKSDLAVLCAIFPEWISVISTNSGSVVRINRQSCLTLKTISEEVHKAMT